ncbi:MAG: NADH-quinone oxidoreductase subunit J [Chloroflexi bacterium]|nr:NADH-quinone oxidoreductase subunit J [Chloroflexota bacterium]
MTALQVIFLATAAMILFSAWMVVTRRNLVHAALYLVLTLFGVAVLFVLLEATFLAVVQVLIYIGAIAILMIFAIMLTRRVASDDTVVANHNAGWAAMLAVLVFSSLVIIMGAWSQFTTFASPLTRPGVPSNELGQEIVAELGQSLVDPDAYVIPFEVASVLLLAALIGAIVVAWQKDK